MLRAMLQIAGTVVTLTVALFVSAGRLDWPMAWAFLLTFVAFSVLPFLVLSPSLIAERSALFKKGDRADALLAVAFALLLYPGTMVVCGLDRRFGWSPSLPNGVPVLALVLFAIGYGFVLWAMRVNPFFATGVRVQRERGHRVIDRGPYAWMRHPGYAGTMAAHLVLPVALGSLWGLVPAVVGSLLLAVRSVHEEQVLSQGLSGYQEYARRVPWRLVPGVW